MEPHKDASAREPRDPFLLPDDTPYVEGHWPDGTPYKIIRPTDPAPRPAPLRPESVAELREWIVQRQSHVLEWEPREFTNATRFFGPHSIGDLLDAARALGLTPPPMPFPVEFTDPQHGLANVDVLLRWLADSSGQPETKPADVNGQPDGEGKVRPKATVAARMIDLIKDPATHTWTAEQFRVKLGCNSRSTVTNTAAWKQLAVTREMARQQRGCKPRDRRRKPRHNSR